MIKNSGHKYYGKMFGGTMHNTNTSINGGFETKRTIRSGFPQIRIWFFLEPRSWFGSRLYRGCLKHSSSCITKLDSDTAVGLNEEIIFLSAICEQNIINKSIHDCLEQPMSQNILNWMKKNFVARVRSQLLIKSCF